MNTRFFDAIALLATVGCGAVTNDADRADSGPTTDDADASTTQDPDGGAEPVPGAFVWQRQTFTSFPTIGVDSADNVVMAGGFSGAIDLGGDELATDDVDLAIARFDPDGQHIVSASFGGPGEEYATWVDVDVQGGLNAFGVYNGAPNLGGATFPDAPTNRFNGFFVRYAPDATHELSLPITSATGTIMGGGATDGGRGVVLAGGFDSPMTIAATELVPAGGNDAYFARLQPDGALALARRFGGEGNEVASAALYDGLGNVYFVGHFDSSIVLGEVSLQAGGSRELFISQLSVVGAPQWAMQAGGTGSADSVVDLVYADVDRDHHLIVAGSFVGTMTFPNGTSLVSNGGEDVFLAKIAPTGEVVFAERFGGPGIDRPRTVAAGPGNSIGLGGEFSGTASFGGPEFRSNGDIDVFLVKLDADGAHIWSRGAGAAGQDRAGEVEFASDGSMYAAVAFQLTVDFGGPEPLTSTTSGWNSAILKYAP